MVKGGCFAVDSLGPNLVASTYMLMSLFPPCGKVFLLVEKQFYLVELLKILNDIKHTGHLQKSLTQSGHSLLPMILRRIIYFEIDSVFSFLASRNIKVKCIAFLKLCDWIYLFLIFLLLFSLNLQLFVSFGSLVVILHKIACSCMPQNFW